MEEGVFDIRRGAWPRATLLASCLHGNSSQRVEARLHAELGLGSADHTLRVKAYRRSKAAPSHWLTQSADSFELFAVVHLTKIKLYSPKADLLYVIISHEYMKFQFFT